MDEGYSKEELWGVCTLRAYEQLQVHKEGEAGATIDPGCCASMARTAAESVLGGDLDALLDDMALGGVHLYERSKVHKAVQCAAEEVMEHFASEDKLKMRAGSKFSVDIYTDQGRRPQMEDKHVAFEDLNPLLEKGEGLPDQAFFGVYDGHGGVEAASFASMQLHHIVATQPSFLDNPCAALKEGFLATDKSFLLKAEREALTCGATACSVLVRGSKLYIGWLGDSQAMLHRAAGPLQIMEPHKPQTESEKKRIEAAGGVVVWYGAWRVNGVLSVARAIGDKKLKEWVIGDPDVAEFDLDGTEEYLILACDGLWDVMDEAKVSAFVSTWREEHEGSINGVAKALVEHCIDDLSSSDNISCIMVFFNKDDAAAAK
mmetsp:Transcript_20321/g.52703  ORF Transcript_20321/g.52703 Transcript_20321/m.52703 type:complete len:374 (+) Transcript_20321:52-1173(+)